MPLPISVLRVVDAWDFRIRAAAALDLIEKRLKDLINEREGRP